MEDLASLFSFTSINKKVTDNRQFVLVTEHRSSYKESSAARAIFERSSPSLSHPQHYIGTIDSLLTTCMCGQEPVE